MEILDESGCIINTDIFDENPDFYDDLRLVLFEADYPEKCNYNKIRRQLNR